MKFLDFSMNEVSNRLKNKQIIIYGGGQNKQQLLQILKEQQLDKNIQCILTDGKNNEEYIDNLYKIQSVNELQDIINNNSILLIAIDGKHSYRPICDELNTNKHLNNLEFAVYQMMQMKSDTNEFLYARIGKDDMIIPRILVLLTHICTLNCKHCAMLVPEVENPKHIPIEEVKQELNNFLRGISIVKNIGLTGGEIFSYPYLKEVLEFLINSKKVETISLLTNGTIVPKDEELIKLLKNKKIDVRISDYGLFEKMSKLINCFEKNKIKSCVCTDMAWWDAGGTKFRNKDEFHMRTEFIHCGTGEFCKILMDNKFFACERSGRMYHMGRYVSDNDYIDLNDSDTDEEIHLKIKKMFLVDRMDACNYCDLSAFPHNYVPTGEQKNGEIYESNYTIIRKDQYRKIIGDLPYTPYW